MTNAIFRGILIAYLVTAASACSQGPVSIGKQATGDAGPASVVGAECRSR